MQKKCCKKRTFFWCNTPKKFHFPTPKMKAQFLLAVLDMKSEKKLSLFNKKSAINALFVAESTGLEPVHPFRG